jgi:hypothetical protein
MAKPHQIEVTHESHYAALRNPDQSQAIALPDRAGTLDHLDEQFIPIEIFL